MNDRQTRARVSTAAQVRSLVGPSIYVVVVIVSLLVYLATRVEGIDLMLAGVAAIGLLACTGYLVTVERRGRAVAQAREGRRRYDVFVSTAVATTPNGGESQSLALAIGNTLRTECGLEAVYPHDFGVAGRSGFDTENPLEKRDIEALAESSYFVLLYSEKLAARGLVHAGAALALGLPSLYFVSKRETLPPALRNVEQYFRNVRVYELISTEYVCATLKLELSTSDGA